MDDELIFNYVKNFNGDIELWNSKENQLEFERILDKVCEQYYKKEIISTSCTETQTNSSPSISSIGTQTENISDKIIKVGYNKALNFKN